MLFNEISWWWNGFIASESSQVTVRSPFLDNDLIKVLYKAPSRALDFGSEFQVELIRQANPGLMSIPTNQGLGGSSSPFISKSIKLLFTLLNTAERVYIRERLPYGMTHWVARVDHLLSPTRAARLITGLGDFRRYRVWFRDQLADFLKETLLNSKTFNRPYWNRGYLEKVVNDHTSGRGSYYREIRKILTIEMMHRVLVEDI